MGEGLSEGLGESLGEGLGEGLGRWQVGEKFVFVLRFVCGCEGSIIPLVNNVTLFTCYESKRNQFVE